MGEVKKNREYYISYIKGFAIIAVVLIHLIDWGGASGFKFFQNSKEFLLTAVMFFVSMISALLYYIYKDRDFDYLKKGSIKIIKRGFELIGIYYIYNIIKLFIFDFNKEPFFSYFANSDRFTDLINILTLKSANVPITILFTLGVFMIISPLFLFIFKKFKYPKILTSSLIVVFIVLNYFTGVRDNSLFSFVYSNGLVVFPIFLWMIPYLFGYLVSMIGFEKNKNIMLPISFALFSLSVLFINFSSFQNKSILPSWHMYPLDLYYVFFSLFFMYLLVYVFYFIKKIFGEDNKFLKMTAFLGDNTLSIYVLHWVIIDLTYWIFAPSEWVIWITVPISILAYILIKNYTKSKIVVDK